MRSMAFSAENLFVDFCIMSVLLVVSNIIRMKVKFFQNHFVPTALIAGVLGAIGGKHCLNIIPFSNSVSSYSGLLVMFLSASLFIGNKQKYSFRSMLQQAGDSFCLNCAAEIGQFGLFILLGFLLSKIVFNYVDPVFGVLMPAGFVGDHGTASIIGGALEAGGVADSISIGQTFATAGLLVGVFGGVFWINYAVNRKFTGFISRMQDIPEELRTGIIPEKERSPIGSNVFSGNSIDTLTWHVAVVLAAIALAYGISWLWNQVVPSFTLPVYGIALLTGMLINWCLKRMKLIDLVDKGIVTRIGGTATDYLVGFGIASINFKVVFTLWKPILILCLLGIAYVSLFLFIVCRQCAGKNWFEKGIFIYGWSAGAMPVAIMLLRITDPEYRSGVLEDSSLAWVFLTLADIIVVAVTPVALLRGKIISTGVILLLLAIGLITVSFIFYGRKPRV